MAASYSSVAASTERSALPEISSDFTNVLMSKDRHDNNSLPDLSNRSVFLTLQNKVYKPNDIIAALSDAGFNPRRIKSCQRTTSGRIVISFFNHSDAEELRRLGSLQVTDERLHIQDLNHPIIFVNLYDVPDDFSDELLKTRLSTFGEVISSRRGYHRDFPSILNGIRHFRMKLNHHIPSYLRFGKLQVVVKYANQPPTCRVCNGGDHLASGCRHKNNTCFNCQIPGHLSSSCPSAKLCVLCRSPDHLASNCPFSWNEVPEGTPQEPNEQPQHPPSQEEHQQTPANSTTTNNLPGQVAEAASLATSHTDFFWSLPQVQRITDPDKEDCESTDSSAESTSSTISTASTNSRKRERRPSPTTISSNPESNSTQDAQNPLTPTQDSSHSNTTQDTSSSPSRKQRKKVKSKRKI